MHQGNNQKGKNPKGGGLEEIKKKKKGDEKREMTQLELKKLARVGSWSRLNAPFGLKGAHNLELGRRGEQ